MTANIATRRQRHLYEAAELQREIEACVHDWVEGEPYFYAHTFELTEATGGGTDWAQKQERTCMKCGLKQERLCFNPKDGLGSWPTQ